MAVGSVSSFYVVPQNADPGDTIPLTPNSRPSVSPNQVETDFELQGIPPGSYYVYPLFAGGQRGSNTASGVAYYATRIPVEVIDRNVTDLRGDIHASPDIVFHVTMKGTPPTSGPLQPEPPRVQLRGQEALGVLLTGAGNLSQAPQPDGSIVFPNVFPAHYKILMQPIPSGYYLADVRRGPKTLYNDAILDATAEESAPVEITLSTGGGEVRGIVRNRKGEPTTARVTLVPQPARRGNTMLYRRAVSDPTTGQFAMGAIAPGEYKLFAFETLPANADESAEFLAKFEARGHAVTIDAGAKLSDVALDLISQ
jgi:hypothetical protein